MIYRTFILVLVMAVGACGRPASHADLITDIYVEDFGSDDVQSCRPADVDLDSRQVKAFFLRASQVEHKVIHDHYNYAPCYIEGTLKRNAQRCNWEIRAGATGYIQCNGVTTYFVCDSCEDLFRAR